MHNTDSDGTSSETKLTTILATSYVTDVVLLGVRSFVVADEATENQAIAVIRAARHEQEAFKAQLDDIVGPIKSSIKKLEMMVKPRMKMAEEIQDNLRGKLAAYRAQLEAAQTAQREVARTAAAAAPASHAAHVAIVALQVTQAVANAAPAGVTYRSVFDAVVEDRSIVPEDFKFVDTGMCERLYKDTGGAVQIPGIKFVERKIPIVRG